MTEEEAWELAGQVERDPPKVSGGGKNGFFMKNKGNIVVLDDVSSAWLRVKSEAAHKTPSELINEIIREKLVEAEAAVL
jgi:hypothetical protein